jgi:7-cyano-7-deazaguanine synthase in queuosine biosynthesis
MISKNMKTLEVGNLSIDIHEGPIGISMSGGADSSILGYILMKYAKGPIHVFSCGNGRTNFQEPEGAIRVVNYLIKKFKRHDVKLHVHWVENKNIYNTFDIDFMEGLNLSMLYSGFTTAPPEGAFTDFDKEATYGDFTKENKTHPFYQLDGKLYTPFININKKGIADLYKSLEIEDLYSITRSCESLELVGDHCGKCWWCKERIWAFGKLS